MGATLEVPLKQRWGDVFFKLKFRLLSCGNPQAEAIGHTRTCLQPESGAGTMHSLQPCQLGNDSFPNIYRYIYGPMPPSGHAWRAPGPHFVYHSAFQENLG